MDFFGGAFDFLDSAFQSTSDFFSGATQGTDAIAGDAFGNAQIDNPTGGDISSFYGGADNLPVDGSAGGGLLSSLASAGAKALGGASSSGNNARKLSQEFHLQGQNRAMDYAANKAAGVQKGLQSDDPKAIAQYWHSLMTSFAYGQK